ncbi:MAG: GGDEF domain-containing protein, partial [Gemmatimonadetes bacterium]|nr:GGDEF domain-containing protein [Gemmatimonadota bacterium]
FKNVNDTYGHDAGDAVLQHVARLFRDGVRTVDIVTRYGGEEIACLLPQTDLQGAREFAERMRKTIESRPVQAKANAIPVTCSFGVATYGGQPPLPRAQLFSLADKALYRSKQSGRNRVSVYDTNDSAPTT